MKKMTDFGYYGREHVNGRSSGSSGSASISTSMTGTRPTFDYEHGRGQYTRTGSADSVSHSPLRARENSHDGRLSDRQNRYDSQPKKFSLLETPAAFRRDKDFEPQSAAQSNIDKNRRGPSPIPRRTKSRSPHFQSSGYRCSSSDFDSGYEGRQVKRNCSPEANLQDVKYGRDRHIHSPTCLQADNNKQNLRDRLRYGILQDPHHPPALLPEPDWSLSSEMPRRGMSFSPEFSRTTGDRSNWSQLKEYPSDRPLLSDPEVDHGMPMESCRYTSTRRSFSPDYNKNGERHKTPHCNDRYHRPNAPAFSRQPPLLPEPTTKVVTRQSPNTPKKSVQDILGGFGLSAPQCVQTQLQMEQTLLQSQKLLQKFHQKEKRTAQKLASLKKEDKGTDDLRKLGIELKPLKQAWNSNLDPVGKSQIDEELQKLGMGSKKPRLNVWEESPLDPDRKRQIDDQLQMLGRGSKKPVSNDYHQQGLLPTPSDLSQAGLLPVPMDSGRLRPPPPDHVQNQDVFSSEPSFKDEGARRHTLLPYPSQPHQRYGSDGLLPTPEGIRRERSYDYEDRKDKWKSSENFKGPNRNRGRNKSKKRNSRDGNQTERSLSISALSHGRNIRETKDATDKSSKEAKVDGQFNELGKCQEIQLIIDAVKCRPTPTLPSSLAEDGALPERNDVLAKRKSTLQLDCDIARSHLSSLLAFGEHTHMLLYDRILDNRHCYICDMLFNTKKDYIDHELSSSHTNKMYDVQEKHGNFPSTVNQKRIQFMQRLAALPSIYVAKNILGTEKGISIKPELVDRNDFFFVCRVCQDVFRGPVEKHYLTESHKSLEIRRVKCSDCQLYYAKSVQRRKHMQRELHEKVAKFVKSQRSWQESASFVLKTYVAANTKSTSTRPKKSNTSSRNFTSNNYADTSESKRTTNNYRIESVKDTTTNISTGKATATLNSVAANRDSVVQIVKDNLAKTNQGGYPKFSKGSSAEDNRDSVAQIVKDSLAKNNQDGSTKNSKASSAKVDRDSVAQIVKDSLAKNNQDGSTKNSKASSAKVDRVSVAQIVKDSLAKSNQDGSTKTSKDSSAKIDRVSVAQIVKDSLAKSNQDGSTMTCKDARTSKRTLENMLTVSQCVENVFAKATKDSLQKSKREDVGSVEKFISRIPMIVQSNQDWKGEIRGIGFTSPVVGFYCKVCNKFCNEKNYTREVHCATLQHQLYMKAFKLKKTPEKPVAAWMQNLPDIKKGAPSPVQQVGDAVVDLTEDDDVTEETTENSVWFDSDITEDGL